MKEKSCVMIRISMRFLPKDPINNKLAMVQVMAWCRTGNKPLPEPMLTQLLNAYMWHYEEMS